MEPKIGIIVCGFSENRQFVTNPYIQSVRYSRGLPFILPLVRSDHVIDEYVRFCDGFLFCGGEDITPLLFGEEPAEGNGKTDITVDLFQIRLMKRVLTSRKPVLAICRGMQILSVACGGTIWQDMSLIPGRVLNHMQQSANRSEVSPVCKQLPPPGSEFPRQGRLCQRSCAGRHDRSDRTGLPSVCHRRAVASRMHVPHLPGNAGPFS